MVKWYHCDCFFIVKRRFDSVDGLRGFESLRWSDQQKIESKLSDKAKKEKEIKIPKKVSLTRLYWRWSMPRTVAVNASNVSLQLVRFVTFLKIRSNLMHD